MRGARLELEALRLGHHQRHLQRELLGELDVGGGERRAAPVGRQGHHAQRPALGDQRDADHAGQVQGRTAASSAGSRTTSDSHSSGEGGEPPGAALVHRRAGRCGQLPERRGPGAQLARLVRLPRAGRRAGRRPGSMPCSTTRSSRHMSASRGTTISASRSTVSVTPVARASSRAASSRNADRAAWRAVSSCSRARSSAWPGLPARAWRSRSVSATDSPWCSTGFGQRDELAPSCRRRPARAPARRGGGRRRPPGRRPGRCSRPSRRRRRCPARPRAARRRPARCAPPRPEHRQYPAGRRSPSGGAAAPASCPRRRRARRPGPPPPAAQRCSVSHSAAPAPSIARRLRCTTTCAGVRGGDRGGQLGGELLQGADRASDASAARRAARVSRSYRRRAVASKSVARTSSGSPSAAAARRRSPGTAAGSRRPGRRRGRPRGPRPASAAAARRWVSWKIWPPTVSRSANAGCAATCSAA